MRGPEGWRAAQSAWWGASTGVPTGSRKSDANLSSSVCVAPLLAWQHDPGRQLQRSRPRTWSDGLMQYGSRQCSSISEPIPRSSARRAHLAKFGEVATELKLSAR